mgnify:CR=1 FL=1
MIAASVLKLNPKELAKELVEAYGWRPSVIKEDPPPVSSVGVDAGAQDFPPQMGAPVEGAAVPPVSDQESSDFLASLAGALPGVS